MLSLAINDFQLNNTRALFLIFKKFFLFLFYAKLTIKKRYSQTHSQGLVQGDLENKTKSN